MAFAPSPGGWIDSWEEDGTTVSFDLSGLTEPLTAVEADSVSGDWRDCVWSIVEHTYQYYNGLATADKPTKLTISKAGTLQASGEMLTQFTFRFYTDISTQDVAAE